ncbi:Protein of unknown function [Lactobacillus helveticus CIRM-BIA 103]|nr:Protein of unknown function [Lactobacillus helveticus CIRM-BIA 103]
MVFGTIMRWFESS